MGEVGRGVASCVCVLVCQEDAQLNFSIAKVVLDIDACSSGMYEELRTVLSEVSCRPPFVTLPVVGLVLTSPAFPPLALLLLSAIVPVLVPHSEGVSKF